jgi:hypothetical protein
MKYLPYDRNYRCMYVELEEIFGFHKQQEFRECLSSCSFLTRTLLQELGYFMG